MTSRASQMAVAFLVAHLLACAVGSSDAGGSATLISAGNDASSSEVVDAAPRDVPEPRSSPDAAAPSTEPPRAPDAGLPAEDAASAPAPAPLPTPPPTPAPATDASAPATDASAPPPAQHDAGVPQSTCVAEGVPATCSACAKCTNGCSCQANGCYNHYFCDTTGDRCVKTCP